MSNTITREDLENLRKEIEQLKPREDNLAQTLEKLHEVLDKLVTLFDNANKEIYDEYSKDIHSTSDKLDQLIQQNEKIARGIVALADLVKQKPGVTPPLVTPDTFAFQQYPPSQPKLTPPGAPPVPLAPAMPAPPVVSNTPAVPPAPSFAQSASTATSPAPSFPKRRSLLEKFSFK